MKRYPGVVTGIVKNLSDPEGQGRIELVFPWLSDSVRSSWAPVASMLAGKDRGAFFMPEIDDEVLVAFEHGDMNHPFIVGTDAVQRYFTVMAECAMASKLRLGAR